RGPWWPWAGAGSRRRGAARLGLVATEGLARPRRSAGPEPGERLVHDALRQVGREGSGVAPPRVRDQRPGQEGERDLDDEVTAEPTDLDPRVRHGADGGA